MSSSGAAARLATSGQRAVQAVKRGVTAATVVCCSITSDNQTR